MGRETGINKEATITPRNRRIDRALQTSKRSVWIATAAVLLVGLVIMVWVVSPTERRRRALVERLEVGDSVSRVVDLLGNPPARCPGGSLTHLERSFPPGWPGASIQTSLQDLGRKTRERWVYSVNPRRRAGCRPRDGQTELGVGVDGRVLWYVAVSGKTPLTLPASYSPARPAT